MRRIAGPLLALALAVTACADDGARRDQAVAGLVVSGAYTLDQARCLVDFVDAEIGLAPFDPDHELTGPDVAVLAAARRSCAPFVDAPAGAIAGGDTSLDDPDDARVARWYDDYVRSLVRDGGMALDEATCTADSILIVVGVEGLDPAARSVPEFTAAEIDAIVACRR